MQRGPQAVTVSAVFSFIALCTVSMRLYCRCWLAKRTGPDDYLVIAALVFSMFLTICLGFQQHYGLGRHFNTLKTGEFARMSQWFWVSILIYHLSLVFVKSSVITQLLRFIFHSRFRTFCWIILGLIGAYGLAAGLTTVFSCRPVSFFWNKGMEGGRCIDLLAFWYFCAAFNIVTDIIVVAIPLWVLRTLQLPRREKLCLLLVFGLGGFGCVTSVLRLRSIYVVVKSHDITWDNVGAATWSSVEANIGIACACLPTLKPLIKLIFPRLLNAHSEPSSQNSERFMIHQPAVDDTLDTQSERKC